LGAIRRRSELGIAKSGGLIVEESSVIGRIINQSDFGVARWVIALSSASCRVQKVRVVALLTFGCTDDDGWIKIIAKHGGPPTP
jgi:hypothetical protein